MTTASVWKRRTGLGLGALLLLGALGWVALRSGPWAPVRVTVTRVEEARVQPALFGIGTVEARRSLPVGPTAAARLLQVHVDVGDAVRPGQLLAELDAVDLAPRLQALDAAQARARSLAVAAEAQQRDAQARLALARANTRRWAELGAQAFVSAGAVEAREQEQRSAEAALQAADASLLAARQELQRLGAEQDGLRAQRDRLQLRAPSAAVVASREAEPGAAVVAGQAVLRLIDPTSLWLRVRFDQGRAGALAPGQPARVTLRSRPGERFPGRVARLEPLGDAVTEERIAQVTLDDPGVAHTLGELVEVTVDLPAGAVGPWVPNAALQPQGGQIGVWKLVDGRPVFAPLQLGAASLDGRVAVRAGLAAGDEIVLHSERTLTPASRLRVVESLVAAPAAARASAAGARP
ncbi:MAG: efflux RND transporter periplasmic adaptor subunit [Burkholderiaceae bacterium]|nr:efflux RND transporter periplasmic adaptor subunit [Burkholderiaceae bacterium]